ncbi:MAG: CHASE domain-containing protein [Gammaproteobacteria bacterium]
MKGSRSARTLPYWFLGFGWVLLSLFLIALVIFLGIRHAKLEFIRSTEALHDRLVQRILSNEVVLAGFSAHFSVGRKIGSREARAYARTMLEQYPHIYQLEAQIKVASSELAAFERRMRAAGYPNYTVRTFNYETDRRWQEIDARPFYYPIYFMEPLTPQTTPVLGLDRTTSWRCWAMSCAIRSHPFATPLPGATGIQIIFTQGHAGQRRSSPAKWSISPVWWTICSTFPVLPKAASSCARRQRSLPR